METIICGNMLCDVKFTSSPAGEQRGGDVRAEDKWEIRDHRINEAIMEQVFSSLGTTCRFESVTVVLVMAGTTSDGPRAMDLQQELKCLQVKQF